MSYIKCGLKSGVASLVMGAVAYFTYYRLYAVLGVGILGNLVSLIAAVDLGVVVYGVLCYLFGVEEVRDVVGKVMERLGRGFR